VIRKQSSNFEQKTEKSLKEKKPQVISLLNDNVIGGANDVWAANPLTNVALDGD